MFGYIYKKDAAAIAVILALCLGVGSFFDYQISSALFNIGNDEVRAQKKVRRAVK